MFLSYQSRWPADVFAAPLMCAVGINLALMTDTLATCPDGTWQLWSIQVPHDPKTKIVVPVVRIPVVAIGRPAVLWIVVPRTAAHNTVQVYPLDANVKQYRWALAKAVGCNTAYFGQCAQTASMCCRTRTNLGGCCEFLYI